MPEESTKTPTLKVALGEEAASWQTRTAPALQPLTTEFGQIVDRPHHLEIMVGDKELLSFDTRFSGVDFSDGKVAGVETNPQDRYLGLTKVADLLLELIGQLDAFGFQKEWVAGAGGVPPAARAQAKTLVYRGHWKELSCVMVLEKALPKDSEQGRLAETTEDLYLIHLTVTLNHQAATGPVAP